MSQFWQLLKESVIVQGLVTLALVLTLCYLYAAGRPVPDSLLYLVTLTVGFFFGAKVQAALHR